LRTGDFFFEEGSHDLSVERSAEKVSTCSL
jgi:hypothetical protein